MRFTGLSVNKQCNLIVSLQRKDYLQISFFLASRSRAKKNPKVLLMKTTESLGGGAWRGILSFINESLDKSKV